MEDVDGPDLKTVFDLGNSNTASYPVSATSVNCAGPALPVTPVGPVGPVAPVGPVGPVAPVGPVGPVAPVGPVGPVLPNSPAGVNETRISSSLYAMLS
jgi:hypothetical protein